MKVLLVDDSRTIRMILKGLLKELEITDVAEAGNGREAIDTMQGGDIDVVFLDIHMPQMDGLQALEFIKQSPELWDLPVVIISSDTDFRQVEKARDLGAFGYIKKPFRVEGLRAAITAAIDARQQPPAAAAAAAPASEQGNGHENGHDQPTEASASGGGGAAPAGEAAPTRRRKGLLSWLTRVVGRR